MARLARVVIPGYPHHVTQRGNRGAEVFFGDDDYRYYLALLAEAAGKAETQIWAYCLMPNHVHLIMTPQAPDGLRAALAEAHRRYTRHINAREGWSGHLWQGRFASVAMDERYLRHALAYVSLNPVRAGLVSRAQEWRWSSVRAHLAGADDDLVVVAPALQRCPDFAGLLGETPDDTALDALRAAERSGRPLGDADWLEQLERQTGRRLKPAKRGPKFRDGR